jgi:hypothetical protein
VSCCSNTASQQKGHHITQAAYQEIDMKEYMRIVLGLRLIAHAYAHEARYNVREFSYIVRDIVPQAHASATA